MGQYPYGMYLIGHRGCMDQYPENTVRAVREAAPHVDAVEIDVQRCATGELVVFHDDNLERVTGVEGVVSETPWSTLADLEVFHTGEPIPQFSDIVAAWPEGLDMNLDIHTTGVVGEALDQLSEFSEDILLSTTNETVLEEADTSDVSVTRGLSFYREIGESIRRALALDCGFVHVYHELCLETDIVERAHANDLRVDAWTVDDPTTVDRLEAVGTDAVTVDRWDVQ